MSRYAFYRSALNFGLILTFGACGGDQKPKAQMASEAQKEEDFMRDFEVAQAVVGFPQIWVELASSLELSPEQRSKLLQIAIKTRRATEPARNARRSVAPLIAKSIETNNYQALDQAYDNVLRVSSDITPARVEALNSLHALLNPAQRAKLGNLTMAERRAQNQQLFLDPNNPRTVYALSQLGTILDLSDDQRMAIRNIIAKRHKEFAPELSGELRLNDDALKALCEAFKADTFDAATLDLRPVGMKEKFQRNVAFIGAINEQLRPKQRALWADLIRRNWGVDPSRDYE